MNRTKKTMTLPPDVIKWAEVVIGEGRYPGVRSFSTLIDYLLRSKMSKKVN